jgi:hypothetical protein
MGGGRSQVIEQGRRTKAEELEEIQQGQVGLSASLRGFLTTAGCCQPQAAKMSLWPLGEEAE